MMVDGSVEVLTCLFHFLVSNLIMLLSMIIYIYIYIYILFFFFKANLTKFAFQLLNGIGDFITLKDVLDPTELPNWDKMTKDEILAKVGIKIK